MILCGAISAQKPVYYFSNITTQSGLSNNTINCIIQDTRGFIWIGTNDGLNRFDGKNFTIYKNRPGDVESLSGNIVRDIYEDTDQTLWIATDDGGISRFNPKVDGSEKFTQFKRKSSDTNSIASNSVTSILDDGRGNLLIGTDGKGIWRFNKTTRQFDDKYVKGSRSINKLFLAYDDEVWVGRQGGGLLKIFLKPETSYHDTLYDNFYLKLPHMAITSFVKDDRDRIWFGSWDDKPYIADKAGIIQTFEHESWSPDVINCMAKDAEGNIWIGGREKGIQLVTKKTFDVVNMQHNINNRNSIVSNNIKCIFRDRNGFMWIGTDRGISVYNSGQNLFRQIVLNPAIKEKNTVYDVLFTKDREIWFATNTGIYKYDRLSETINHVPIIYEGENLLVSKFFRSAGGKLYLGTDRSLFVYENGKVSMLPNTAEDKVMSRIISSRILDMAEVKLDGHSVLFTLPFGHYLTYYDFDESKWYSRLTPNADVIIKFGLSDNLIKKVLNVNGKLLFGNTKAGLSVLEPGKKMEYHNNEQNLSGLNSNNISDFIYDSNKLGYWVSTFGGGLHFVSENFDFVKHYAGSPNLSEGIVKDDHENMWIIANGNICKLSLITESLDSYTIPAEESGGGVTGKIFREGDEMVATGNNFFVLFNPDKITKKELQTAFVITDFKVLGKSIPGMLGNNSPVLKYNQNSIRIEFAAPITEIGTDILYSYRIVQLNNEWIDLGTRNFIEFANLKPGNYNIEFRYTYHPGTWVDAASPIFMSIKSPFWFSWWFVSLFILSLIGAAYVLYKFRLNQLKIQHDMRQRISQDLHDHVGSTLSGISLYSKVATIHLQNNNHGDLDQLLTKISESSSGTISDINDIVWAINPDNDTVMVLINRMKALMIDLLPLNEITFEFNHDENVENLVMSMAQRKNLFLIFKESVNNIIKHARASHVDVEMKYFHNKLLLGITDNGIGFDQKEVSMRKETLSGNGLKNIDKRCKEINAKLNVETKSNGTKISLSVAL